MKETNCRGTKCNPHTEVRGRAGSDPSVEVHRQEVARVRHPSVGCRRVHDRARSRRPRHSPPEGRGELMDKLPAPTKVTISLHMRRCHGYSITETVNTHELTLLSEHERIHQKLDVDHTHEDAET